MMFGLPKQHIAHMPLQRYPLACTWLVVVLLGTILPHIPRLPAWIILTVLCFGVYRVLHDHLHWRLPARWLLILLALITTLGIVASFGVATGRRAALAFLVMLLGLKLLETHTQRDVMVLSCLGYFLVITNALYSQSLGMLVYLMGIVWLLTITVMHFQHLGDVNGPRLRANLRYGSVLCVQALPLMLVLFVLFPRIHGPLWSLPDDASAGVTGFSDHMSPGHLTELSESSAVAFRVDFANDVPPHHLRYWRGLVLWDYDGSTWHKGTDFFDHPIQWRHASSPITYTVMLEPHEKPWLFSLDLPAAFIRAQTTTPFTRTGLYPRFGTVTSDLQLRAHRPIREVTRYTLQSYVHYDAGGLTDAMRRRALQLPDTLPARVRELAQQWRQTSLGERDVVQQALQYFQEHAFVYTLRPPVLPHDPTYAFLFETRRGYCEHFASSFTVLMRAAGVPARVVVGYQGGEVNPLSQHLTVRQSNAHAWAEVWLPDEGWVRVDPTAVVAPERIETGIESFPELAPTPIIIRQATWLNQLWRQMRLGWDAVHYTWNHWVLQYSAERQVRLMASIGLGELTWQGLTVALVILLSAVLAILALRLFRPSTPRDRVVLAYQRFCRKLARRGIVRRAHEGPLAFAQRVQQLRPELVSQVDRITQLYSTLRYGRQRRAPDVQRLRDAVRAFRP
jgi:transglutaminase-like putative cysteine protease